MNLKLGPNWKITLSEIIHEAHAEIGVHSYANLKTGEVNLDRAQHYQNLSGPLLAELNRKADVYRRHATGIRQANRMRPFNWELETQDRIQDYIRYEKWQLPKLRKLPNTKEK